jgi:preprotein translocase subunit SecD
MLYISKWKQTAILLTAFIVCLLAVPNFFPESTVQRWPKWAQRHIVLGLDLQGGSHILLEVDRAAIQKERAEPLRDDIRRALREARIGYTGLVATDRGAQVRLREPGDTQAALTKIRELSQAVSGGGMLGMTTGAPTAQTGVHVRFSAVILRRWRSGFASQRPTIRPTWLLRLTNPSLVRRARIAIRSCSEVGRGRSENAPGALRYEVVTRRCLVFHPRP